MQDENTMYLHMAVFYVDCAAVPSKLFMSAVHGMFCK